VDIFFIPGETMFSPSVKKIPAPLIAIITATVLFGSATPVLKILVSGMTPLVLLGLLGIGSCSGVACWWLLSGTRPVTGTCLTPDRREWALFLGTVVVGGLLAPFIQILSLPFTPAATASLLLNFEIVATVLVAFLVFHEPEDRKIGAAIAVILAGSLLLSWNGTSVFDFSPGAAGIILAGFFWGLDNNFMAHITAFPPEMIGVAKAGFGGCIAWVLVILLHDPLPPWDLAVLALLTGFVSFGLGLVLFIQALRAMGAARAGAVYAAAPFIGCMVSLLVFSEPLDLRFWIALPLFAAGVVIVIWDHWSRESGA
jgi:drug/metabolite transporter (DMT)-like permease